MSAEKEKTVQVTDNVRTIGEIDSAVDWFVVKTSPRHEKKVAELAHKLGYVVFLPLQTSIRIWSDRKKKVQTPLIPSVLFVQNPEIDMEQLYALSGVRSVLRLNGAVARVKPQEIQQLKIVVGEEMEIEQLSPQSFVGGEEVEIISGPLRGFFAKAVEELTRYRVLLEISNLGTGYCVNLAKKNIRKL